MALRSLASEALSYQSAPEASLAGRAALVRQLNGAAKRGVDIAVALLGLLLVLPLMALIALAVALEDGRAVLYRAQRVGREGRVFTMYKFRTMYRDADRRGLAITGADDPRITRMGRLLRASKLDELPQLWNVLRGQMSLVGPRPEAPAYVAYYTPAQRAVLSVRPGITGPAQVVFRDEASLLRPGHVHEDYIDIVLPRKLAIDLAYVAAPSLWRDLGVLVGTLRAIVAGH